MQAVHRGEHREESRA